MVKFEVNVLIQNVHRKKTRAGMDIYWQHHMLTIDPALRDDIELCGHFRRGKYRIGIYIKGALAFRPSDRDLTAVALEVYESISKWANWEFDK